MSVTITVDGREIEAPEGARLIDVCREHGIDIPHFCYHPGLGPDGNCRMCQVEFVTDRGRRLGISCKTVVTDGMVVETQSEAAKAARASVEEFLLLNHPLDCPICDKAGECTLQNYYMEHDLQDSRQTFTRFRKHKALDIGPTLVLDQERCVLCDRCVRFLKDIAKTPQLYIAGRGHGAYITPFPGQEVTSPYSLCTVDLCPVGALTSKDFRFGSPTWFLKNTETVCTTCARGCSMQLQEREGRVLRFRPRYNPEVNGYWACDEGRLNYHFVNDERIDVPQVRRGGALVDLTLEEAVVETRRILGFEPLGAAEGDPAVRVAVVLSANCTLEEMHLARGLAERLGGAAFIARHRHDGVDDHLLRRADRHANARGAELLGLDVIDLRGSGPDASRVREALGEGGVLVAVGFDDEPGEAIADLAAGASATVAISGCTNAVTEAAELVIPGVTFAEKDGLLVNFEGHVQRLRSALRGVHGTDTWRVLEALRASLAGEKPREMVGEIRQEIRAAVPALADVDLLHVGPHGVRLAAQPVA